MSETLYPKVIEIQNPWTLGSLGRGGNKLCKVDSAEEETALRKFEAQQIEQSKKERKTLVEQGYGDVVPFL